MPDPDELFWCPVAVVGEEHATLRREGGGYEGPERPESPGWHVRQPKSHEHDVVPAARFPGEQVSLDEPHRRAIRDAARRDREHFRGRIDGGNVAGVTKQLGDPGAGTAGQVKDAARRPERVKRLSQPGAAGKIGELVKVVRGEGTVVGTLLGQELVLD